MTKLLKYNIPQKWEINIEPHDKDEDALYNKNFIPSFSRHLMINNIFKTRNHASKIFI